MFNIIIAEPNFKIAGLMRSLLESAGYSVMTSDSGINILAKARFFPPDLIICRTALSDMSGYDLCKKIKSNSQTRDCLVLLLYNIETKDVGIKSLEAGADDFMETTFDTLVLKAKVKSLLRIKSLSNQLKEKYFELEEKNNILDRQLEMSRQVQSSLVQKPKLLLKNIIISNLYLPSAAIGGDFYDIIPIDDVRVAIIIGDVSGHGISSALITTMALAMIRGLRDYYHDPCKLLARLNAQFIEVFNNAKSDMYLCAMAAFIDTEKMTITYSNSGLNPPLYINYNDSSATELNISGIPIGMFRDVEYECKTLNYQKNDLLLFFTDGLMDIFYKNNPSGFISNLSKILLNAGNSDSENIKDMILDEFYKKNATGNERLSLDDVCFILCQL